MPPKRYKSTKRYKLSNLTVDQANDLLRKHHHRVPAVAAELGVTPQAFNRWLRLNDCRREITLVCSDQSATGK